VVWGGKIAFFCRHRSATTIHFTFDLKYAGCPIYRYRPVGASFNSERNYIIDADELPTLFFDIWPCQ
jgi:hypothetical protein